MTVATGADLPHRPDRSQEAARPPSARLITPAPPGSRSGNRVTAVRWGEILDSLGWQTTIDEEYRGQPCDLLVALHAARSAESVERFHRERSGARGQRALIVACTGTDLYRDLASGDTPAARAAERSLELADRLVVLHPLALKELPDWLRPRTRVIVQSVRLPSGVRREPPSAPSGADEVRVLVAAHLRQVKDPLRAARAAALLPGDSRVAVRHVGGVLEPEVGEQARRLEAEVPRYRWLGEVGREDALARLAEAHALVISSWMEGAPNVLSEALALGVPVIASDIPGNVGLLGPDHPALYPAGDERALAALLRRLETEPAFYQELEGRSRDLSPMVDPSREQQSWRRLLREVGRASHRQP